jgi:hypothetical protein
LRRAEQEKEAIAAEKARAVAEVAAKEATGARSEAEQALARISGQRKDAAAPSGKPPAGKSRMAAIAAVALLVGAGGGYMARQPSAPVSATPAAPILVRAADEPLVDLRLDQNLESLTRVRPQGSTVSKKK